MLNLRRWQYGPVLLLSIVLGLGVWLIHPSPAQASVHIYRERPGQVTVRSRQSLRDYDDRAWQAIAFKRSQKTALQGLYLRLVGFPDAVQVQSQQPVMLFAPTGQSWQLPWLVDAQTQALPPNVGQYDLRPFLDEIDRPLPLEMQLPVVGAAPIDLAIAPFIVKEWLQVVATEASPTPVGTPLGK